MSIYYDPELVILAYNSNALYLLIPLTIMNLRVLFQHGMKPLMISGLKQRILFYSTMF